MAADMRFWKKNQFIPYCDNTNYDGAYKTKLTSYNF